MVRPTVLKPVTIETIDRVLKGPILQPIAGQIRAYYHQIHTDLNTPQRREALAKLQRLLRRL